MKITLTKTLPAAALAGLLVLAPAASGRAQSAPPHPGHAPAAAGGAEKSAPLSSSVKAAVEEALLDELRGEAMYGRVLKDHGDVRPFSNVVRAERRHAAFLEDAAEGPRPGRPRAAGGSRGPRVREREGGLRCGRRVRDDERGSLRSTARGRAAPRRREEGLRPQPHGVPRPPQAGVRALRRCRHDAGCGSMCAPRCRPGCRLRRRLRPGVRSRWPRPGSRRPRLRAAVVSLRTSSACSAGAARSCRARPPRASARRRPSRAPRG